MGTHIVLTHTSCIVDATCATATREPLKTSRYLERESFVCLAGRILTYLFLIEIWVIEDGIMTICVYQILV